MHCEVRHRLKLLSTTTPPSSKTVGQARHPSHLPAANQTPTPCTPPLSSRQTDSFFLRPTFSLYLTLTSSIGAYLQTTARHIRLPLLVLLIFFFLHLLLRVLSGDFEPELSSFALFAASSLSSASLRAPLLCPKRKEKQGKKRPRSNHRPPESIRRQATTETRIHKIDR